MRVRTRSSARIEAKSPETGGSPISRNRYSVCPAFATISLPPTWSASELVLMTYRMGADVNLFDRGDNSRGLVHRSGIHYNDAVFANLNGNVAARSGKSCRNWAGVVKLQGRHQPLAQ